MAGADTISTLDSSAFETIKQNARNSKARKLIHQDALQDSHIIAERQRDRGNFLKNSKSLAGDAFDMMEDTYSTSSNRHAVNEEVGQAGIQYDQMLEQRMAKLQQGMNQQQMSGGLGLVNQNRLVQEEAPRAAKFLPKEIVEAFKQNPINNDPLDTSNMSANDEVQEVKQIMKNSNNLPTQKVLNEQTTNGVDYGLIKTIIESAVKKYANALNKRIISENKSTAKGNISELKAMKIGNKFSFISENGDIYEAKLIYKGNIKDKK